MTDHEECRRSKEYSRVRSSGWHDREEAELALGHSLSDAEMLALWDNKQDQNLVDMGR